MRREILICLALSAIVLIGFWPVGHLGFILFDDHDYITENPNVQAGITVKSVCWAFTNKYSYNWHPVTWLSHMLDYKLFGLNAGGHHWMNLGFHTANVLLLFLVLNRMMGLRQNEVAPTATQPGLSTPAGTVWRNALVAALFALHPLHLQSVAWVSERKDLLSGFFAMLTLWAWVRYVEKSKVQSPRSKVFYGLALIFFALGLMSKPMLVTVPFVLLLLDYWPLRRISDFGFRISDLTSVLQPRKGAWPRGAALHGFTHSTFNHLLFEKLPFVALSLVSCIVTMRVQSVVPSDWVPWDCRLENALVSYAAYLGKFCWPENLAIFYPYPQISLWKVFGPGLLLVGLSVFCIRRMHSQPWLFVGWFWFAVMLLPVIGLVQVGMQSMADRYTYLPSIGLFIIVAWGMAGIASISSLWRTGMVVGAAGLLLACLLETRIQLGYWRNNVTLFSRAVEVTGENPMGNYYLGDAFLATGNLDEAAKNYRSALRMAPHLEEAYYRLGCILLLQKKSEEAGDQFGEVLRLNYDNVDAHVGLGHALATQRKYAEAEAEYSNALVLRPDDTAISKALAVATLKAESGKALTNFYEILKVQPTPEVHIQIAAIQTIQGDFQEAVEHYLAALQLKPDSPEVLNNLAWLLTTCPDAHIRDGAQAVKHAERACELTHYKQTIMVGTLAAAFAEAGRFDDAISAAQKACTLATGSGKPDLLKRNQDLLALYRAHKPYHEIASPNQAESSAVKHASGGAEKFVPTAP